MYRRQKQTIKHFIYGKYDVRRRVHVRLSETCTGGRRCLEIEKSQKTKLQLRSVCARGGITFFLHECVRNEGKTNDSLVRSCCAGVDRCYSNRIVTAPDFKPLLGRCATAAKRRIWNNNHVVDTDKKRHG